MLKLLYFFKNQILMRKEAQLANDLIEFIYNSPSNFHVILNIKKQLDNEGFVELKLKNNWNEIKSGGKYYVIKNNSAIFAFKIGTSPLSQSGIKLICAHSDSPCFKIKPSPEIIVDSKLLKLNTEVYGAPILSTWLDRPLSVAGRVTLKSENPIFPQYRFVDFRKPLLTIPNLAIHFNREVNNGYSFSKQKDMQPLLGVLRKDFEKDNYLLNLVAKNIDVDPQEIVDFDLTLYDFEKGCLIGKDDEMISSPKLDDLAMVHAGLHSLLESNEINNTQMLCVFDNEEVGSVTQQGAGSPVLKHIIERIALNLSVTGDDYYQMIYNSFMISADMAHSIHPNHIEKHDPVFHPVINSGPVIKINANQKYTTDGDSGAVFAMLCQKAKIPYQKYVNHSDMPGGSTLGNISVGQLDIRTVDIGNPMLAMHSIRELGGVYDHAYVTEVFKTFYNL